MKRRRLTNTGRRRRLIRAATSLSSDEVITLLQQLTGQRAPNRVGLPSNVASALRIRSGLGHSQFNELLLLLGYDRVCADFFQYLVDGTTPYRSGAAIKSLTQLKNAVTRFRKLALLLFGNVKFAFKRLGGSADEVAQWTAEVKPTSLQRFRKRHAPIRPIEAIPVTETYLLGYMIEAQLRDRLAENPSDPIARALEDRRLAVVEQGRRNHASYLVSDHLDVYVATSMRERHEYVGVSDVCRRLFSEPALAPLKLRWFDPTQAYCKDRIDKGLAEALMLKRAKCTLYLAQETDTLGKDSELASTLAQGKTVIAYVPIAGPRFVDELLKSLRSGSADEVTDVDLMLGQLRIFAPQAAWKESAVREWLSDVKAAEADSSAIRVRLAEATRRHYEERARTLQEKHPLGIQVNLYTGVATGVLVARTIKQCAELIRRIVTGSLQFDVQDVPKDGLVYVVLRERITKCVYRVMTGDQQLTNAFWNFYLQSP